MVTLDTHHRDSIGLALNSSRASSIFECSYPPRTHTSIRRIRIPRYRPCLTYIRTWWMLFRVSEHHTSEMHPNAAAAIKSAQKYARERSRSEKRQYTHSVKTEPGFLSSIKFRPRGTVDRFPPYPPSLISDVNARLSLLSSNCYRFDVPGPVCGPRVYLSYM